MPTIVSNNEIKKVPNVKPINNVSQKSDQFSNISFPFGKQFGPKIFGELSNKLSGYKFSNNSVKIPIPGEGLPRVIHYCADQSGCAFWRMLWPGDELLAHNKAVVMSLYQMVTVGQFYGGIDAVKLQRQCTEPQLHFIKFLREVSDQIKAQTGKGFRIIWEVDDICFPAADIPEYNVCRDAFTGDEILKNVTEMMKYVDEVTVVSEYMRQHYKKHLKFDKITVIPNYAPKSWIDRGFDENEIVEKYNKNRKPRILYAGSGTHFDVVNKVNQNDDFGHVVDFISEDITKHKKYDWVFFGAMPLKLRQFIDKGIEFHQWCSILEYPAKLRELDIDVSIAPLQNNNFSRAKANIKLTETGTQGIPCVAQNIECYNSNGWKYLFNTAEEMFLKIDEILKTEKSYLEACKFARQYSEKYFLQDHLDEYTLVYTTDYGDPKRKENESFLKNNLEQFT
jgi:hypothetical protein